MGSALSSFVLLFPEPRSAHEFSTAELPMFPTGNREIVRSVLES